MNNQSQFKSINPFSEEVIAEFDTIVSEVYLNQSIEEINRAQKVWMHTPLSQRIAFLPELAQLLREQADFLAQIASEEMGKLFSHAKAEVLKSASLCEYYEAEAALILGSAQKDLGNGTIVKIEKIALGTVLGIFPWNFPFWQILRSAIPTLVAGNAMLVKPAPNVPQSALALQKILEQTCLPKHLFSTHFLNNEQIEHAIGNPKINAVTFTGSTQTGAHIAGLAGKHLKPVVVELGGSDPLILLDDVDLPAIIDEVLFSRFQNNGQSCVAAKRFLVHTSMKDLFLNLAKEKIAAYKIGNPLESDVFIGPIARKDLQEKLQSQVQQCLAGGATLFWQQDHIPSTGYFFPPSILCQIPVDNLAAQEELFGPVLSVFEYSSEEELITIANSTQYGLGASIFTSNLGRAERLANQIESGMVYINQMVKSDPRIPFGGIKKSGFGRELGPEGLLAFCQTKTTWVKQK